MKKLWRVAINFKFHPNFNFDFQKNNQKIYLIRAVSVKFYSFLRIKLKSTKINHLNVSDYPYSLILKSFTTILSKFLLKSDSFVSETCPKF